MSQQAPLRLVFDTNVYLAGLLSPVGYVSTYLLEAGLRNRFVLFSSVEIFGEVRSKYASQSPRNLAASNSLLAYLGQVVSLVESSKRIDVLKDEPDNRILECAEACQADLIVSFDKHLLDLKKYGGTAIIHPSLLQDYFPR